VKDYARLRITPPMGRHPCERSTHSSQDLSGCATGSRCGSDWDRARPVVRQNARCSARGSLSQLDSDLVHQHLEYTAVSYPVQADPR